MHRAPVFRWKFKKVPFGLHHHNKVISIEAIKRGPNGKPDLKWAENMILSEE